MVPSSLDTVVTRLGVVGTGTLGRAGGKPLAGILSAIDLI